jgi:uncharacterized delta-60 repeat protein
LRGRRLAIALVVVAATVVPVGVSWAAGPGTLDPNFSGDGWATAAIGAGDSGEIAEGVAVERDRRIVAAGYSGPSVLHTNVAVARFKPDGSLDRSFAGDGTRTFNFAPGHGNDAAGDVAAQRDGRIVVTGFAAQSPDSDKLLVARFRPSGRLDRSFSGDGRATISFPGHPESGGEALAIGPRGKILVAGFTASPGKAGEMAVARFRANGKLDRSFSGDGRRTIAFPHGTGSSGAEDVAVRRDGTIILAGSSEQAGTGTDFAVATLEPDGSPDRGFSRDGRATFAFDNGGNADQGEAIAVGKGGKLAIAGGVAPSAATSPDFGVLRLNQVGTPDRSFSGDGRQTFDFGNSGDSDFAVGVAFQPDGKLIVGGSSHQGVHGYEFAVARLDGNGDLDRTFSDDGRVVEELSAAGTADDDANAMALQRDGGILLAGESTPNATTGFDFSLARFLGSAR